VSARRVVVTGLGAITPLGEDVDAQFDALMTGVSGVRPTTRFDTSRCPVKTSGEIHHFDPKAHRISRRDLRTLDRYQQYVLAAAQNAIASAGLDLPENEVVSARESKHRFDRYGAAIGMAFSSTEVLADQFASLAEKGTRGVSPRLFNMTLPNAGTSLLSVRFGLAGPLVTVSGASASGSDSLIAGYDKVKNGRADRMLAGGAESAVTEIVVSGFAQNNTGSRAGVCRPFDRDRDGTVLGEGAAVLVLEEYEHARARKTPSRRQYQATFWRSRHLSLRPFGRATGCSCGFSPSEGFWLALRNWVTTSRIELPLPTEMPSTGYEHRADIRSAGHRPWVLTPPSSTSRRSQMLPLSPGHGPRNVSSERLKNGTYG